MQFTVVPDLKEVGHAVDLIVTSLPIDADAASLCLTEALNNSILHGSVDGLDDPILIETSSDTHCVTVRITDHRRALTEENFGGDMDDLLAESGRGFPIIQALCEDARITDGDLVIRFSRNRNTRGR